MPLDYILTKGKFCTGLQCHKLLWMEVNAEDEMPEIDSATELLFKQGREVTKAARKRFPKGDLIKFAPWDTIVDRTKEVVDDGVSIIFEGTFLYDETLARVDVLKRVDGNLFDIIEVKMATEVKDQYLPDVALQRYVVEGAGLGINKTFIMHLNSNYVYPEPEGLFLLKDYTEEVNDYMKDISHKIKIQKDILKQSNPPEKNIGPYCSDPYECSLIDVCWEKIPEISVFNIPGLWWSKRWGLFDYGIISVEDLPTDHKLNTNQKKFIQSAKTNQPVFDKEEIKRKIDLIKEPLYFMDFETMNWAMPKYEGCKPYYQVPFQWSLHIIKDGELDHREFLAETPDDPRREFTESLIENIGKHGPVIVYHKGFEKSILNKMAEAFSAKEEQIRKIIDRLWDLEDIFKYHYMDARFLGSTSLKNVLPVIVPDLSYDDLEVCDGGSAQAAYVKMIESEGKEKERLRKALFEYCGMDTMAMVEIYIMLRELT